MVRLTAMDKEIIFCLNKTVHVSRNRIALSDICSFYGMPDRPPMDVFFDVNKAAHTITAFDVLKKLYGLYPDHKISNTGPMECHIFIDSAKQNKAWVFIKVIFICLVMFFGGAIAIMTFHEDVDMRGVHSSIYNFFTGIEQSSVPVVSIPYSMGIAIGFIFLFGLYKRKKKRPTVLEIDMNEHENAMRNYLIEKHKDSGG